MFKTCLLESEQMQVIRQKDAPHHYTFMIIVLKFCSVQKQQAVSFTRTVCSTSKTTTSLLFIPSYAQLFK